jgi:ABC-type phosphate/phosphonate transport system substrate-binding protein
MVELAVAFFLFLKTGEKFATQEAAGPSVAGLTGYVGDKLGTKFEPRVMNDPKKAVEFCMASKPSLGIVTPGFYLAYAKALGMEPLLETKRTGVPAERYIVIAKKDAGGDLTGKVVATTLAAEERYVIGVVLQAKFGRELRLKPVTDIEGAVFDLVEGVKAAADAVLMEQGAWALFKDDPELGPKLKVVFESSELPRDLVVRFGSIEAEKIKSVLKQMSESEEGKRILRSIRVDAFVDVDRERLAKVQMLFHAK